MPRLGHDKLVEIKVVSYRKRVLDKDNAFLSIKALVDALRYLEMIEDDSPKKVLGPYFVQIGNSKEESTEIRMEELG